MRTKLLAVGLLALCLVVGLGSRFQPENKQWEYKTEELFTAERANQLGADRWELIIVTGPMQGRGSSQYIYKRHRE